MISVLQYIGISSDQLQASLDADGLLSKGEALALASTNLNKIFGLDDEEVEEDDLVVYEGGDIFSMESKVIGIISPGLNLVKLF